MPWVRLHAVKDYLDMLVISKKYPRLKLNFNIVPLLMDSILDYVENGADDLHSKLTVTPLEEFSVADKEFVLNNFFDANYANMILPNENYAKLYKKRFSCNNVAVDIFSEQEYSDLLVYFNLCWIDSMWKEQYPELKFLIKKEKNYTLDDRRLVIDLHRQIMAEIVPTYKKMQEDGKIEILTSPYYHPIMPLLADFNDVKNTNCSYEIPKNLVSMQEDLKVQIKKSRTRMKELFGKIPKGMWTSEQAISKKVCEIMLDCGVEWTLTDEGLLANTLEKEFVRDFRGYLEDPFDICQIYSIFSKNKKLNVLFRESILPNLLSFEYPNHNQIMAANDLYERIKGVQDKLVNSPSNSNLLTIAMDGENCWENYANDGNIFLSNLYKLLEQDETLETVTVSEYLSKNNNEVSLSNLASGSGINRNYKLWIGDEVKNLAWSEISNARKALLVFEKENSNKQEIIQAAWKEIYSAQSSDWFWWYGEPNHSGQDHIFDYLFREQLKHVYELISKPTPKSLEMPLEQNFSMSKQLDGQVTVDNKKWELAGFLNIPSGPVLQTNQLYNSICYGCDNENLYLKFDVNKILFENYLNQNNAETYIYFHNFQVANVAGASVMNAVRAENLCPVLNNKFTHVLRLCFNRNKKEPPVFSIANENGIWIVQISTKILYAYDDVLEIKIPFDEVGVQKGETIGFFAVNGADGVADNLYPKDSMFSIIRPE